MNVFTTQGAGQGLWCLKSLQSSPSLTPRQRRTAMSPDLPQLRDAVCPEVTGGSVMPPAQRVPGGARAGQPGKIGTRAAMGICPTLCKLMLELFYIKTVLN